MTDTIPTLSLWQPWASAIACGAKRIETRSWSTAYRGPLLIHAGKSCTFSAEAEDTLTQMGNETRYRLFGYYAEDTGLLDAYHTLPFGAIIAVAELVDCLPVTMRNGLGTLCLPGNERLDVSAQETALGDYTPGRYGLVLRNVRALPEPIPYRGRQGLFRVPADVLPVEYRPLEAKP